MLLPICDFMKESTLLKIAFVCSLAGIVILFLISDNIEISEKTINQLDRMGEDVIIKGTVTKITEMDAVSFIELSQNNKIVIVLFKDYPIDLEKGEVVEVIGKTEEYNGELELIGKEVRVIE